MAGEWLKVESATPEKPEVLSITVKMGWDDPDLTVGKLFKLWRWFDQQTTDGNAVTVTCALLDRIVGAPGFAEACASVGWLLVNDSGISLPNFERHNGATAKSRAQTAKRVANHKSNAQANAGANGEGNAVSVSEALPREEKKREERNTSTSPAALPTSVVVDLYHEALPELPKVRLTTEKRKRDIAKFCRWVMTSKKTDGSRRAETPEQAQAWIRNYFERARDNDFLMGRTPRHGEHANWQCDLDFLLTEKGMKHVIEKTREVA